MHRATTTLGLALASAALLITACSSNSTSPTPHRTATATHPATQPATTAAATNSSVKLSTTWVPKLEALANGTGVADCASDSGSASCIQAIGDDVDVYGKIATAITNSGAATAYPKTIAEVTKLIDAASSYSADQCPGDPHADITGSPCPKEASTVTVGASTLQFVMQTDETNTGT